MAVCALCGGEFEQLSLGRPRKNCQACAPSKVEPGGRLQVEHECDACGESFLGGKLARYCSDRCRSFGSRSRPCTGCSTPMLVSRTSSSVPFCLPCRRAGKAPSNAAHGESRYSKGCRCAVCRSAVAKKAREYNASRKAAGLPLPRSTRSAVCEGCGKSFLARRDGAARFCSMQCAGNVHGRPADAKRRPKIPITVRRRVFEAAGYACELCESPTRPEEDWNHPRYPTLDHIVPFSKGGSDDESNLRLACRQCNTLRGANEEWVPVVEVA